MSFILDGIPPAPRGVPQIEVTFDIDANGILTVTAKDKATGRSQHITITASSGLTEAEIERMQREAEMHAEEDRRRKELVEARNYADNTLYAAEKTLKDYGDKIPSDVKQQVEQAVQRLKDVMQEQEPERIRAATEELGQVLQKVGAGMYQSAPGAAAAGGSTPPPPPPSGDEDVVDGEFKEQ
ncbi:MAG: Hsp70 family protein [Bellilinea sp.]|nr:Hsp70 family protein [Bellilinea sp.]